MARLQEIEYIKILALPEKKYFEVTLNNNTIFFLLLFIEVGFYAQSGVYCLQYCEIISVLFISGHDGFSDYLHVRRRRTNPPCRYVKFIRMLNKFCSNVIDGR